MGWDLSAGRAEGKERLQYVDRPPCKLATLLTHVLTSLKLLTRCNELQRPLQRLQRPKWLQHCNRSIFRCDCNIAIAVYTHCNRVVKPVATSPVQPRCNECCSAATGKGGPLDDGDATRGVDHRTTALCNAATRACCSAAMSHTCRDGAECSLK